MDPSSGDSTGRKITRVITRTAGRAATMTTEAAGAVGSAAVNGVVGGVSGVAGGVRRGLRTGSSSTPAAALALGAVGVAGLVEWPILVAVGGTALAIRQFSKGPDTRRTPAAAPESPARPATATNKSAPRKSPATSTAKAASKPAGAKRTGSAAKTAGRTSAQRSRTGR